MDLAAHGNSSFHRQEYTMVAFAEDIKAVIEKEQVDSVILVVTSQCLSNLSSSTQR